MPVRKATWYGPGFYGRRTACGQTLRRSTLGVAHKTLPCGTAVTFYLLGRFVTVPVIDRGPYAPGVHFDLTAAAASRLGLSATRRLRVIQ
jgi:rare lipoprotein A